MFYLIFWPEHEWTIGLDDANATGKDQDLHLLSKSSETHCCSVAKLCLTLPKTMDCSTPGFPVPHHLSLPKFMSTELVMPSSSLIVCHPLLFLPSVLLSIRVFSSESAVHIRWLKYWSFSFSISPSNEYSGMISFKIEWFDLLAFQGTLSQESSPEPQFESINSSVLCLLYCPALTSIQDKTKRETIALIKYIFVGKVTCLLFNMQSRFVIAFLPRSKHLLIP